MGKYWRRFNERVRQQVVAPHFQPASTGRNQMMFREASMYLHHFKAVVRKLLRVIRDYEDMTTSVDALLKCRVPRLYTVETDGSVGAEMHDVSALLGTGEQLEFLSMTSRTLSQRMTEEVIASLQQWFKNYDRCHGSLNVLSGLKFEVDSRRRTVLSLDEKQKDNQLKVKQGDMAQTIQLQNTSMKLNHKERKLEVCQIEFQHQEEQLNQALRALLAEVQRLTELIGHVYEILSEAPVDAQRAFKEGGDWTPSHSSLLLTPYFQEREPKAAMTLPVEHSNPFFTPPDSLKDSPL